MLSAPDMTSSVRLLSERSRLLSILDEISAFVIAGLEASMLLDAKLKLCPIVWGLFSVFNNFPFAQDLHKIRKIGSRRQKKVLTA